jgi:hypothetical protein
MDPSAIRDRVVELRRIPANQLLPHPHNAREHPEIQREALRAMMQQLGFAGAILAVERDGRYFVCDGHLRQEEMGTKEVPVLLLDLTDPEVEMLLLSFDQIGSMAKINQERLATLMASYEAQKPGMDPAVLAALQQSLDKTLAELAAGTGGSNAGPGAKAANSIKLADRFLVPPFSVLDARQGYWQERKRQWLALGIQSEVGRGENLLQFSDTVRLPPRRNMASPMNSGGCADDVSQRINTTVRGGPRPGHAGSRTLARSPGEYGGGDAYMSFSRRPATAVTYGSGGPGELAASYRPGPRAGQRHQHLRPGPMRDSLQMVLSKRRLGSGPIRRWKRQGDRRRQAGAGISGGGPAAGADRGQRNPGRLHPPRRWPAQDGAHLCGNDASAVSRMHIRLHCKRLPRLMLREQRQKEAHADHDPPQRAAGN